MFSAGACIRRRVASRLLLVAWMSAVVGCSREESASFHSKSNAVKSRVVVTKREQATAAKPSLTVGGAAGPVGEAFRAELEARGVGRQGKVDVTLTLVPSDPEQSGNVSYTASYDAIWMHPPEYTHLTGTRSGEIAYELSSPSELGKRLAAHEAEWLLAERPPGAGVPLAAPAPAESVTIDLERGCSIHRGGSVRCWDRSMLPLFPIQDVKGAQEVVLAPQLGCARLSTGKVRCWAPDKPATVDASIYRSKELCGFDGAVSLGLGKNLCGVMPDGKLVCWRAPKEGLAPCKGAAPQAVPGIKDAEAIAMSTRHTVILRKGGKVVWLPTSDVADPALGQDAFHDVSDLQPAAQVSAGMKDMCAVVAGAEVWCWSKDSPSPERKASGVKVSSGFDHSCALDANGKVSCFGANARGQLGLDDPEARDGSVSSAPPALAVAAGNGETCVAAKDGLVHCWGGGIGDQDPKPRAVVMTP